MRIVKDQAQRMLCLHPWSSLELKWVMAWALGELLWAEVGLDTLRRFHPTLTVLLFSGVK